MQVLDEMKFKMQGRIAEIIQYKETLYGSCATRFVNSEDEKDEIIYSFVPSGSIFSISKARQYIFFGAGLQENIDWLIARFVAPENKLPDKILLSPQQMEDFVHRITDYAHVKLVYMQ